MNCSKETDRVQSPKKKNVLVSGCKLATKVGIAVGIMYAFYKVPGIIAEKISYKQLMKKDFDRD